MWIRSQDRRSLSNVNQVLISNTPDESKYYIYGFLERGRDILGVYSSEEKALEVLDDIQFQVKYFDPDIPLFYEMPKDDEVEI